MSRRPRLSLALGLVALLSAPLSAPAQDGGTGERPSAPAGPARPGGESVDLPIQGFRYRIKLRNGSRIEGILVEGVAWEKRDAYGDYVRCDEKDKEAGLRLQYVLNMEGETFIRRRDIADEKGSIHDLGELSAGERLALREKILEARKKAIAEEERRKLEEYERLAAAQREAEARAAADRKQREEVGEVERPGAALEEAKGDELLKKFPPPDWSEKKRDDLLRREIVVGVYRNDEEREFTDPENFKLWKAALERRQKADAAKEGGGEKKETPPGEGREEAGEGEGEGGK